MTAPLHHKAGRAALPWGVHRLGNIFAPYTMAGLPDGRRVMAVCMPYQGNRLVAAWWVLTGRAYALRWPEDGELEEALSPERSTQAGRA